LLDLPVLRVTAVPEDNPITDYYISSSHNTYLLSRQLIGQSSAASYTHVLGRKARCVEIDVWASKTGLIVTHGHTFSRSISLSSVLQAISSSVQADDWPVFVSLECHVPLDRQDELVTMLKTELGTALVVGQDIKNMEENKIKVSPGMFKGRIVLMVEYFPPAVDLTRPSRSDSQSSSSSSSSESSSESSSSDSEGAVSVWPGRKHKKQAKPKISDSLAELGFYCRSMKPQKGWFAQSKIPLTSASMAFILTCCSFDPSDLRPTAYSDQCLRVGFVSTHLEFFESQAGFCFGYRFRAFRKRPGQEFEFIIYLYLKSVLNAHSTQAPCYTPPQTRIPSWYEDYFIQPRSCQVCLG
jgi:hypothetical protein